jgi:acyl-coenzyme A thioesterase PaaI-like protein
VPSEPPVTQERLAAVAAARRLAEELASSTADAETFAEVAREVSKAADLLAAAGHASGTVRRIEAKLTGLDAYGERGPFTGALHVPSAAFAIEQCDRSVTATATYGPIHEGAPNCVHGGFITGAFDEILALAQAVRGLPRMTATLSVSYRAPAPLYRPLRYTAAVQRIDGRKAFVNGALFDGETLCAEATALFIAPRTLPAHLVE